MFLPDGWIIRECLLCLQVGITDKEQYIHRLGCTAHAGLDGRGMIILSYFEKQAIVQELKDVPTHAVELSQLKYLVFTNLSMKLY